MMKGSWPEKESNTKMLIWILMVLDLMVFTALTLTHFNYIFLIPPLISSATYLGFKGLVFRDVMSMIDASIVIYIILMIFGIRITIVYYFILGWFSYKFLFTLVG